MSDIFNPTPGGGGGSGTVTQVNTDATLTGGPITTTGTLGLATAAAYTVLANNTGSPAQPSAVQVLILGTPGYTPGGANYQQLTANNNSYTQLALQNSNSGSSASSDFVVTSDNGNDTTHYADFGINNSTGGIAPFTTANAAYLYSTDNEVDIGALGASGVVNIYTTGTTSAPVSAARFTAGQNFNVVNAVTGANIKSPCRVATTAALTATYSNGTAGVGATLTNSGTQAAIAIDGVTLAANDRVLVWNQASTFQNGIYIVTTLGSGATNWVLTRSATFDGSTYGIFVEGLIVPISEGTLYMGAIFVENGQGPFTIGTTPITFVLNSAGGIVGNTVVTWNITGNGAASASPFNLTGTPFAGNGTTSTPLQYFNQVGSTQPSTWSVAGTFLGWNLATGTTSNIMDLHNNGGASLFSVSSGGSVVCAFVTASGPITTTRSSVNGALLLTGAIATGGTGTTNLPAAFIQPTGTTAVTTWAAGTGLGMNLASGFAGNFLDFHKGGGTSLFAVDSTGAITGVGTNITGTASGLTAGTVTTNANLTGPVTSVGNATTLIGSIPFSAGSATAVGNQTFLLIAKAAFSGTINTLLAAQTTSGTITVAVKINGTNVTGLSAVSVTSTPGDTAATAANTFAVGDIITLVTSSSSSDLGLGFNIKYTRT